MKKALLMSAYIELARTIRILSERQEGTNRILSERQEGLIEEGLIEEIRKIEEKEDKQHAVRLTKIFKR